MSAFYYESNEQNGLPAKQQRIGSNGHNQRNSVDEYMMPEEEWEREAVLDPAWERQQKKVINHRLHMTKRVDINLMFLDIYCLV